LDRKLYPALKDKYDLQESYSNLCQLRFTYWKQQGSYGKPPHVPKQRNIIERRYSNSKTTYAFRQDLQVNNASTNTFDTTLPSKLPNAFPIIWDSGASVCITFDRNDFLNFKSNSSLTHLKGFSKDKQATIVKGEGDVIWHIEDTEGILRALKVRAYFVPASRVRLASVTSVLKTYVGEDANITTEGFTLSGIPGDPARGSIFAPTNLSSQLPISIAHSSNEYDHTDSEANHASPVVSEANLNLSPAQKELLRWHQRLGHLAFKKVQYLMKTGVLAKSELTKRLHRIACRNDPVKCAACQYAKQRAKSQPGMISRIIKDRAGIQSQGNLLPGQEICVDHFICSTKGRLFTSKGKSKDDDMYSGGAIFVDQASGHIHIEFQTTMSSHATLIAKESFESTCRDYGVVPQSYLSDNGSAFTSANYRHHLMQFAQIQRFAGVGAHHQNSRAERSIQTVMSISRAMMIHSSIHWPDLSDTSLWPMAVQHAVHIWNHVPNPETGLCPSDLFTRTRFEQSKLHDIHVFGCPVYVLDKSIADGKKIPRWNPRSQRCMYLGKSNSHASNVPLVLNPATGSITPQFHVVFDDWFATVNTTVEDLPDFNSPDWTNLFGESEFQYILDDEDMSALRELSEDLENSIDSSNAEFARNRVLEAVEQLRPASTLDPPSFTVRPKLEPKPEPILEPTLDYRYKPPSPVSTPVPKPEYKQTTSWWENADVSADVPINSDVPKTALKRSVQLPVSIPASRPQTPPVITTPATIPVIPDPKTPIQGRRSTRTRNKPSILDPSSHHLTAVSSLPPGLHYSYLFSAIGCSASIPISINAAKKNTNPDILNFNQAMASEDRPLWIKAAEKEIYELELHGCWIEVPRSEAQGKIVPSQWIFRLKRRPDGSITKHRGRIVLRGDLMDNIHDVTSPVVAFSTVRLFLIMSLHLDWYTCSVDFANAFIQADHPDNLYMQIPRGFTATLPNSCLKLIKNIYGACDGPKLWAELLFNALKEDGFTQSKMDQCLWYKRDCFIIVFVDDCGIASKTEGIADDLIARFKKKGFSLTKESSFEEFLGIQYATKPNGDVELTQQGLIKKILSTTGLEDCNPNRIPATEPLSKDPVGMPMTESWSYPSVIGMLLYLSTNTRPDIAFAVSQAARFTHDPKQSHASAVKTIIRYLKKTLENGTIVTKPKTKLTLDCFTDADFAGLYRHEPDDSIDSARSRSGYIIKLGACPLIWKSQLIPTICLSTAESEYYALSQSMRALLPIQRILEEFMLQVDIPQSLRDVSHHVHATVHEDNTSALSLATEQRITSRTRHYHCRWHFFWQAVQDSSVEVIYCNTTEQQSDYMTKALCWATFIANRRMVQGW
jgi:hypothetical protein